MRKRKQHEDNDWMDLDSFIDDDESHESFNGSDSEECETIPTSDQHIRCQVVIKKIHLVIHDSDTSNVRLLKMFSCVSLFVNLVLFYYMLQFK